MLQRKTFSVRPRTRAEMHYRMEKFERETKLKERRAEKLAARGRLKTEH